MSVESDLSDHARVDIQLNLMIARKGVQQRIVLQRNKADVEKIRSELTAFRTKYEENNSASVQDKWDQLEGELKRLMKQHIPTKKSSNRIQLLWFDRSLWKKDSPGKSRDYITKPKLPDVIMTGRNIETVAIKQGGH